MAEAKVINGVDVTALGETIKAISRDPDLAQFKFRVTNRWDTCGHNRTTVQDFYGTKQEIPHAETFTLEADEPPVLLGTDQGANPVEHLLNALVSCLTSAMVYHAAARGIAIESVESTVEGDIDSRMLTIGEGATVKGAIAADTVRISGSVFGQIKATTVILAKTAKVSGDITHQTLTMEAGAVLEGGVRRMETASASSSAKVSPFRSSPNGSAGDAAYGAAAAGKSM